MLGARAAAQQTLTLADAIALAQRQGFAAAQAASERDAEMWRDRAFNAGRLPQLSLEGRLPEYNRAITPVFRPDGTTAFVTQREMQSSVNLTLSQLVSATGGEVFISSGVTRLDAYGQLQPRLWRTTPFVFGIRQPVFRSNTLKWENREQNARAEIATQRYLEAREEVSIETANAFFELYAAEMALQNATANAAVNDTLHLLNTGRYEVGRIGENDLLQSELAVLRARNQLDGARLDRDRTMATLKRLTNLPADAAIEILVPSSVPDVQPDTTLAVAQALANRSAMRSLELDEIVANRQMSEARLNTGFGATVSAIAGYNQTAPLFDDAYRSLLDQQRLTVAVEMPIIQWGGRRAEIQAARAEQDRVGALGRETRADDRARGAFRGAPTHARTAAAGDVGQGGHGCPAAVRRREEPVRHWPDRHWRLVHRADREGPGAARLRPGAAGLLAGVLRAAASHALRFRGVAPAGSVKKRAPTGQRPVGASLLAQKD